MQILPVNLDMAFFQFLAAQFRDRFVEAYLKRTSELHMGRSKEDVEDLLGFVGGISQEVITLGLMAVEQTQVQDYHFCDQCANLMEWVKSGYVCGTCEPYCFHEVGT